MAFKHMDNEAAVSPIVATLVLIVVAVVGAVAVGTIMGTFSSDVSEQANAGDVAGASSAEILIAGSTTVYPASLELAKAYMNDHPGVKITVQGGGSGAGVASVGMGIADIGAASRNPKDAEMEKYPDIEVTQIGGSAVVFIANDDTGILGFENASALKALYDNADADGKVAWTDGNADNYINASEVSAGTGLIVYQRAEASGTEDTAAKYVGGSDAYMNDDTTAVGASGNAGVLAAVQGDAKGLGFVDFGYADGAADINMLTAEDCVVSSDNIEDALAGGDKYPSGLTRPLNYLTNGAPSSIVKDYLTFCQSPEGVDIIESEEVGMFGYLSFA